MFKLLREKLKGIFGGLKKEEGEKASQEIESLEKKEIELEKAEKTEKEKLKEEEKSKEKLEKLEQEKSKAEGKKGKILAEIKEVEASLEKQKKTISKELEETKEKLEKIETEEVKEKEKIEKLEEKKKGIFSLLREKLTTTKIDSEEFESLFQQLEIILLENNIAVAVINQIKEKLKNELLNKPISRKEVETKIKDSLKESLSQILLEPFDIIEKIKSKEKPFVIVFFGINGSGKTTTIAKVAHFLQKNKFKCVLAASDTFRAASIEQLEKHAEKLKIDVVKHQYGADPAAVAFDAVKHAKASGIDVVLIDTAGRMHTKTDLMREMEKISRVTKPDLKIFIGESITGNDAVEQASAFNKSIGIDAIILTKADVDEKGGAMISVSKVTGKPILFLGTGQGYNDLEKFDKNKIINSIF